jgi:hypothetical protein
LARWFVLAIVVVLESILNGFFFAEGSETGLIGGVTQAFVLSVLNVGGGVLYAHYGLPLLVHVRQVVKVVGALATIGYLLWALGINLSIGHFRDLFIQNAGHVVMADLSTRLNTVPLTFNDARSLLLVALGIGLSIVSVIHSSGMDDIYPGFGAIGRRRLEALSAYVDHKARCLAGLTERRDAAISEMSEVLRLMQAGDLELRLALDGRQRLHDNYRAYVHHLCDGYERLVQRYREANIRARSAPNPARFQARPTTPEVITEVPVVPTVNLSGDSREQIVSRIEHFIRATNHEFETAVRRYETVAGLAGESSS